MTGIRNPRWPNSGPSRTRCTSRTRPWAVGDVPDDHLAAQMQVIVGIGIPVERIEGKWKLSQNRPEADRAGVVTGLSSPDDPNGNAAMAALIAERERR